MIRFALAALAVLVLAAPVADAGFPHRRLAAAYPVDAFPADAGLMAPGFPAGPAVDPGFAFEPGYGPVTVCPTNPCIKYRHKHAHRHKHRACCPEPTYETVLEACSPETGRMVAIPVCLPACCDGCPCQTSRATIFGCGLVRWDYACGVSVTARFTKHGDILVTYIGF